MGFNEESKTMFNRNDMPLIWVSSLTLLTITIITMTIAVSCLLETYLEFKMAAEAGLEQRYVEGKQYPIWVSKEGKQ